MERYWWKYSDDQVYELFERRDINSSDIFNFVRSKVILLGRYYLTGIERKARSEEIADAIVKNGFSFGYPKFDQKHFNKGINIYTPQANLAIAIKAKTNTWETVFASKWLHFHQKTAFPIIDSFSEKALFMHQYVIDNTEQWEKEYDGFYDNLKTDRVDYDDRYCWFCYCLLHFKKHIADQIKKEPSDISVKELDIYLFTFFSDEMCEWEEIYQNFLKRRNTTNWVKKKEYAKAVLDEFSGRIPIKRIVTEAHRRDLALKLFKTTNDFNFIVYPLCMAVWLGDIGMDGDYLVAIGNDFM